MRPPRPVPSSGVGHGERADLREVLPHDVQGPAADKDAVSLGDDELLEALVVGHRLLAHEHAALGQRRDEGADALDVGGSRTAEDHVVC